MGAVAMRAAAAPQLWLAHRQMMAHCTSRRFQIWRQGLKLRRGADAWLAPFDSESGSVLKIMYLSHTCSSTILVLSRSFPRGSVGTRSASHVQFHNVSIVKDVVAGNR